MKRLYRNTSDVMIAGVCSGIAKYLDVDPTAIRLAFVVLLFIGLGGLWIYLVLWIIMPVDPGHEKNLIKVEAEKKTPAPKKTAAPKQTTVRKTTKIKTPVQKPVAKQTTIKSSSAKKQTSQPGTVEENKK